VGAHPKIADLRRFFSPLAALAPIEGYQTVPVFFQEKASVLLAPKAKSSTSRLPSSSSPLQIRETWLLSMQLKPSACTSSSTLRVTDPFRVGLLHHRQERRRAKQARFQEAGEVSARARLEDAHEDFPLPR